MALRLSLSQTPEMYYLNSSKFILTSPIIHCCDNYYTKISWLSSGCSFIGDNLADGTSEDLGDGVSECLGEGVIEGLGEYPIEGLGVGASEDLGVLFIVVNSVSKPCVLFLFTVISGLLIGLFFIPHNLKIRDKYSNITARKFLLNAQ